MEEDGQRLAIAFDSERGRSELRVGSVLYSDAGNYLCRAIDLSGNVEIISLLAVITVQGAYTKVNTIQSYLKSSRNLYQVSLHFISPWLLSLSPYGQWLYWTVRC